VAPYPPDLDIFVDKRALFKVEVSDANLFRNWQSFTVKKLTLDDDTINRFLTLHGLNVRVILSLQNHVCKSIFVFYLNCIFWCIFSRK
jgi:membrane protein required for beta-lactamase induction